MKILVIGDSCIDEFVYGKVNRICPEAPVPVLLYDKTITNDGMAKNVYNNFISVGAETDIITNKEPIIKTRFVDESSDQMMVRLDKNDTCKKIDLSNYDVKKLCLSYDAVVISDYNKGFLSRSDIQYILMCCRDTETLSFLDSKKLLGSWCCDSTFIKINEKEWERSKKYYNKDNVIITKGSKGAFYKGQNFSPIKQEKVFDVCGAGDTFLAAFAFLFLHDKDIEKSISFANICAGLAVQERGVSTIKKITYLNYIKNET